MPDAVPSPLRAQIAHAIRPFCAPNFAIAAIEAVLPLVEAAADAAAKAQLVENQLWISERAEAIREAERLRLHTQLRAARIADVVRVGISMSNDPHRDREVLGAEAERIITERLLGVAATPQPAACDHPRIAHGWGGPPKCLNCGATFPAATPQPEAHDA